MKKLWLMIILAAAMLLAACTAEEKDKADPVEYQGEAVTITSNEIIHKDDVYRYKDDGNRFTVTYPNGATYYCNYSGALGSSGWSNNYDTVRYIPGDVLMELVDASGSQRGDKEPVSAWGILLSIALFGIGVWRIADPCAAWFVHRGWMFENAEPSEWGLITAKISGGIAVILSIVLFIASLSGTLP